MTAQKTYTFFTIVVPEGHSPNEWAKRSWDYYGFDYDLTKTGKETICAWAYYVSDRELSRNLDNDSISFTTFQVTDLDRFLGL